MRKNLDLWDVLIIWVNQGLNDFYRTLFKVTFLCSCGQSLFWLQCMLNLFTDWHSVITWHQSMFWKAQCQRFCLKHNIFSTENPLNQFQCDDPEGISVTYQQIILESTCITGQIRNMRISQLILFGSIYSSLFCPNMIYIPYAK